MRDRATVGFGLTTILVVISLAPGGIGVMEPILLAAAALVAFATLAPSIPLLCRLPFVGAPAAELRVTVEGREELVVADPHAIVVMCVAVNNKGSSELERARLNVLVPEPITVSAGDAFGNIVQRGSPMPEVVRGFVEV
jgi:hypothetical protein